MMILASRQGYSINYLQNLTFIAKSMDIIRQSKIPYKPKSVNNT